MAAQTDCNWSGTETHVWFFPPPATFHAKISELNVNIIMRCLSSDQSCLFWLSQSFSIHASGFTLKTNLVNSFLNVLFLKCQIRQKVYPFLILMQGLQAFKSWNGLCRVNRLTLRPTFLIKAASNREVANILITPGNAISERFLCFSSLRKGELKGI